MDRPATIATAKHQAAMTSNVLRIIFNNLTLIDDTVNFGCSDHSVRSRHLADSVGKKQYPFSGCLPNFNQDVYFIGHPNNLLRPPP